ncbi:MAG TPA: DUF4331 family protein [Gemmatimonadaceae bacterium]|nr:DUF4331 family protein [Gemmatimonadaceae bacterium]
MKLVLPGPRRLLIVAAVAVATSLAGIGAVMASDHQDTPEVELNSNMDINDVYVFPGSSSSRTVIVLTTASPIAGSTASFDPNLLYQIKVDNTGDAREDLVFQVTFNDGAGSSQQVSVRGPVAPLSQGTTNTLVGAGPIVQGSVGTTLGAAPGVQVFAGIRADPFFIDLEQFFRIIPDRRPATGPLSTPLTQQATAFRNPGVDLLGTFNTLAIVIEVPTSQLISSTTSDAKIGVWATISR